jgi:hypothetical protein
MIRKTLLAVAFGTFATAALGELAMQKDLQDATERTWTYLADNVMGGVSKGASGIASEDGVRFVRLTGEVSTENNGGFIQVRTKPDPPDADAQGLVLKVRGNGERYFIHLRTRSTRLPWQYYQAGFDTGPEWQEVRLPWSAFERSGRMMPARVSPETIRSVGLVAFGKDHTADVSLAGIGLY